MARLACFILCALSLLATPVRAQPTLAEVQDAYNALDGLQASFTQVISSDFAGDTTQVKGSVLLSGNKYRVETPDQIVTTNGTTTWIYTPTDSQVVLNDADRGESTVTPETFLTASADQYAVQSSSTTSRLGTSHWTLHLEATRSSSRFREATLWVRQSDRLVTRMRATDRNGSTLDLRLTDISLNPDVLRENNPFSFSPPPNVEVIDLRRGQQPAGPDA
ncbi:cell envelope biogenesis protein LolA [Salinibacter sp. 10B]|uniref:LolA family protein n=1 Tax=Salinibacter sp. 10B TaxID=1923971 RepID=UPI000CF4580C|nr:outer membrane lipoprotein carrier protein LolA [Salinibacter sp. 10B]PQJ34038.1 cell envelope biogenesis protein LolA [Salinibacter sp. 10B]